VLISRAKLLVKRALVKCTGSEAIQRVLYRGVALGLYLMGIGAGASPEASGERAVMKRLRAFSVRGRPLCVFDVGANTGQFARLTESELTPFPHEIHAFEPGRSTFDQLSRSLGGHSHIHLNNMALGKKSGEAELYYDSPGSALASLTKRNLDHLGIDFSGSEVVHVDTVDGYCTRNGITHIDLLKLDVEGHELDVLQGATEMLATGRVSLVTFEFGGTDIDTRTYLRDFYILFGRNHMKALYRITPSGYLAAMPPYAEIWEQFRTTNFLVVFDAQTPSSKAAA
jgi:FkbM family methyltransferase